MQSRILGSKFAHPPPWICALCGGSFACQSPNTSTKTGDKVDVLLTRMNAKHLHKVFLSTFENSSVLQWPMFFCDQIHIAATKAHYLADVLEETRKTGNIFSRCWRGACIHMNKVDVQAICEVCPCLYRSLHKNPGGHQHHGVDGKILR